MGDEHLDPLELAALHDGESAAGEQHLARCPECRAARDALARLDGALRRLADPAPSAERRARLQPARRARWRAAVAAAAVLLLALLGASRDLGAPRPQRVVAARATARLPSPLPYAGPQNLERALATHRALEHAGLRRWWVDELVLVGTTQRRLLLAATQGGAARELALAWWTAHPERAPIEDLTRLAGRRAEAVALGLELADGLSGWRTDRLVVDLARAAKATPAALAALGRRRGAAAVPLLAAALERPGLREAARRELDRLGREGLSRLAPLFEDVRLRPALLGYLAVARRPEATGLLARALAVDPAGAIEALARRGDARAVPLLAAWQADAQHGPAAMGALARLGPAGVRVLQATLRGGGQTTARRALAALDTLPGDAGAAALAIGLERPDLVRETIERLGRRDAPAAYRALAAAAERPRRRKAVYAALARSKRPRAIRLLLAESRRPGRGRAAMDWLVRLADPRALPALERGIGDPRYARTALETIAAISDPRATGLLIQAMTIPPLRAQAHRHLQRRTGQKLPRDPWLWWRWHRRQSGASV